MRGGEKNGPDCLRELRDRVNRMCGQVFHERCLRKPFIGSFLILEKSL